MNRSHPHFSCVLCSILLLAWSAHAAVVTATYNTGADVPVIASSYTATGNTVNFTLNYAPTTGTILMVVKNTGLDFINGTFSNLARGQAVALSYGGVTYSFVANYYGGSGNDLVLQWANTKPMAWGTDNNGQLGVNTQTQRNAPVMVSYAGVLAGKTVTSVTGGQNHSLAICSDGTLAAWGTNDSGQLGDATTTSSSVPVAVDRSGVLASKTIIALAAGSSHSLALCSDGTVAAWGWNGTGQLGRSGAASNVPVAVNMTGVLSGKTVIAVAAGRNHSIALCSDGTLAAWGYNNNGQLGNNSTNQSSVPVAVDRTGVLLGKTVTAVATEGDHSLALCSDSTVAAWGDNYWGQCGDGTTTTASSGKIVPVAVNTTGVLSGKTIVGVVAGFSHSLAICSDGTLATWGGGFYGQLGNNSTTNSLAPVAVSTAGVLLGKSVVAVSAGIYHNLARCSDGTLAAWGYNFYGQLGNNSTTQSNVPVTVTTAGSLVGKTVTAVSAGPYHSLARCSDGSVAAWGYDGFGQLGINTIVQRTLATSVTASGVLAGKSIVSMIALEHHSLALCSDGTLAAWGANEYGQLGNNSLVPSSVPVLVSATGVLVGKTVVSLGGGDDHSLAVCSDGTVAAWGYNSNGGLGTNYGGSRQVPALMITSGVLSGKKVISASGGWNHSLVLCSDGTLATAGWNQYGVLGNNSTAGSGVPVLVDTTGVLSGKTVIAASAGNQHNLVLCSDGTLASWGYNSSGQLGNSSTTNSSVPVAVNITGVLSGKTVIAVSAGYNHSLALCSDGTLAAWGYNGYGQLGNNTTTQSTVPVAVNTAGVLLGKTVIAISAGQYHSMAMCSDGTLVAWGRNSNGQLGNNSATQSNVPVMVSTSSLTTGERFILGATGEGAAHSLAIVALPSLVPVATTGTVSGITAVAATLNGTVNPNGLATTAQFEYGPTTSYGSTANVTLSPNNGATSQNVSASISGLQVATTYHYRLTATNSGGTTPGEDLTFVTTELYTYTTSNGTITITGYAGSGGAVSIPDTINGLPVTSIGTNAFYNNTSLTNVTIPNSVTSIGSYAFRGSGLTSVTIPTSVTSIGSYAFSSSSLTTVTIGPSVTSIGSGAFRFCNGLTAITVDPSNTTYSSLGGVLFNKAQTSLIQYPGGKAGSYTIPSSVTIIEQQAFNYCIWLTSVTIPNSVTSIGSSAFYYCPRLTSVTIGNSVTNIGRNAFGDCTQLTAITVDASNSAYSSLGGVLFNKSQTTLIQYPGGKPGGYAIPISVTSIGEYAFWVCPGLISVTIPSNVSSIGSSAFQHCSSLPSANFMGDAPSMGTSVFDNTKAGFTVRYYNGKTGFTSPTWLGYAAVNLGDPFPVIAVDQPAGTGLTSGSSTVNFGSGQTGVAVPLTFTIKNTGSAPLTISSVTIDGTNGTDFAVTTATPSAVAAGSSTTFTVTFTPSATFSRSGALHIVSNDPNTGTFNVNLTGSGALPATYTTGSEVPVTASSFTATGNTVDFTLNYAPATGAQLMVVKNTGLGFINGRFGNLAQGQIVPLTYNGVTYNFVANYYGGTGNDLVLQWAATMPMAWGFNNYGQLGNSSTAQSNVPVMVNTAGVLFGKTVMAVAAAQEHSLALCSDGTVAAWGRNAEGQLGNNTTTNSAVPVLVNTSGVLSGKTVIAVSAGWGHSLVLCTDGTVAAWGRNAEGQLGNTTTTNSAVPVLVNTSGVLSGKTVISIVAGEYHNMALCSDGTLVAWGYNIRGQLGNNSITSSPVPIAVNTSGVLLGKTVISIAAGWWFSLALCSDGTVATWGYNAYGQLGNNSVADSRVPVAVNTAGVLSGKAVTAVASGGFHSLALCLDGTLAAWGHDSYGQLGNNSTTQSNVPVAVNTTGLLAGKTVIGLSAGDFHSLVLCSDATLATWGLNSNGQLGNNSTVQSSVPVVVNNNSLATGTRWALGTSGRTSYHSLGLIALPIIPYISVQQPAGTNLTNGVSTVDFGSVIVGANPTKTFTIQNSGGADLTLGAISLVGTGSADFTVTASPISPVTPLGGTTTFAVSFNPGAPGLRTATLVIANNDSTRNPFYVKLSGAGVPGLLPLASAAPGNLSSTNQLDEWTFYGRAGRTFTIAVNPGSGGSPAPVSPQLLWANVQLLDASNNVLSSATNTAAGTILYLKNAVLVADGTYKIRVTQAAGHSTATGNYLVTVWDATPTIRSLNSGQQAAGNIAVPYGLDQWNFSAAAGQQVQFDLINASSTGLRFTVTGPSGPVTGLTDLAADSALVNLPSSGNYTLSASGLNGATGSYAFQLNQTAQIDLSTGTPYNGTLSGTGQAQIFKIDIANSSPMLVSLTDSNSGHHNELYVKFGAPPTRGNFDHKFGTPASSNQQILVPNAGVGTWYILVYGDYIPTPGTYMLNVSLNEVFLTDVTPKRLGNSIDAMLTLTGAGFDQQTAVQLVAAGGNVYPASSIGTVTPTSMTPNFAAGSVPPGHYTVRVTAAGGGVAELPAAFEMLNGGLPHFEQKLVIPAKVGYHMPATLYIDYTNSGTAAMPAPLLEVSATQNGVQGAFLTLDASLLSAGFWTASLPTGFRHSVRILASGAVPGLLQPGESVRVPVYYAGWQKPWNFAYPPINFTVNAITAENLTAVDWAAVFSAPVGLTATEWQTTLDNVEDNLGTTWGDYVRALGECAAAQVGYGNENVRDADYLQGIVLAQAGEGSQAVVPTPAAAINSLAQTSGLPPEDLSMPPDPHEPGTVLRYSGGGWVATTAGGADPALVPARKTVVIIHGINNQVNAPNTQWVTDMAARILSAEGGNANVLAVDWGRYAHPPWINAAVAGTKNAYPPAVFKDHSYVPEVAVKATRRLFAGAGGGGLGLLPGNTHIVGHSAGAHIAQMIGIYSRYLKPWREWAIPPSQAYGIVGKITLLDPSVPSVQEGDTNLWEGWYYHQVAGFMDCYKSSAAFSGYTDWGNDNFVLSKGDLFHVSNSINYGSPLGIIKGPWELYPPDRSNAKFLQQLQRHEDAHDWYLKTIYLSNASGPFGLGYRWHSGSWAAATGPSSVNNYRGKQNRNGIGGWLGIIDENTGTICGLSTGTGIDPVSGQKYNSWAYPGVWQGSKWDFISQGKVDGMFADLQRTVELYVVPESSGIPSQWKADEAQGIDFAIRNNDTAVIIPPVTSGVAEDLKKVPYQVWLAKTGDPQLSGQKKLLESGEIDIWKLKAIDPLRIAPKKRIKMPSKGEVDPYLDGNKQALMVIEINPAQGSRLLELYQANNKYATPITVDGQGLAADAGRDQSFKDVISTVLTVTLDGRNSGPDDQIQTASYVWKEGDRVLAQGPDTFSTPLAVGEHNIVLTITDLQGHTHSDSTHVSIRPPFPPVPPFDQGDSHGNQPAGSQDPNAMTGPTGYGAANYVPVTLALPYRIDFENDSSATAPAQWVTISNSLSAQLDWSTFRLTEIGFGDQLIVIPPGTQYFQTTVPITYNEVTFDVRVEAGIHSDTGEVYANFQSIDPATSLPPDVLTGFLPPEDGTGRGMGHVSYSVMLKEGLATGTEIPNIANISFDGQPIITTDQVDPHDASKGTDATKRALVTIDAEAPVAQMNALPAFVPTSFAVSWSGSDVGSGIASYTVYVSANGGDYTPWLTDTTEISATYNGVNNTNYSFYVVAKDNVNNMQQAGSAAVSTLAINNGTISVEQPSGTTLTSGGSPVSFGTTATGTSSQRVFTVMNTVVGRLTLNTITIDGSNASDFAVTSAPGSPVLPEGSTFTVTFIPSAVGSRSAVLHIPSNDTDHTPFDIGIQGTGDTFGGELAFAPVGYPVMEGGKATLTINRTMGSSGVVTVKIATSILSASPAATAAVIKDYTANTQTISFGNGVTSQTFEVQTTTDALVEANETFLVTLSTPTGGAVLGSAAMARVTIIDPSALTTDVTAPALTLTKPAANALVGVNTGGSTDLIGTAADAKGVKQVEYRVVTAGGTPSAFTLATLGTPGGTSTMFTAPVTPVTGINTVEVKATDYKGNTKSLTRIFKVTRPLQVILAGTGTVSTGFAGTTFREVSKPLTITATSGKGQVFDGWTVNNTTGTGITAAKQEFPALTFTFTEGLVLTAKFIPNPFTSALVGTFNGLALPSATLPVPGGTAPSVANVGLLNIVLGTKGSFTGSLKIDGTSLSTPGLFDNAGVARFGTTRATSLTLKRTGKPDIEIALQLDMSGVSGRITGSVTQKLLGAVQAVSNVVADRAHYSTASALAKVPATLAGSATKPYTLVFPSKSQTLALGLNTYPQGDGYATMTVNVNGTVSLTGKLADHTPITASAPLSKNNQWPIFAQLYATKGSFAGLATLTDADDITEDVSATDLLWFRPFQNVQWYKNGWPAGITVDLFGARYVVPPALPATSVFPGLSSNSPNTTLSFTDGLLAGPISQDITISTANLIVSTSPTLVITKASGLISGTFTHSDLTKPVYQGVIVQKGANKGGHGYFMSRPTPLNFLGEGGKLQVQAK